MSDAQQPSAARPLMEAQMTADTSDADPTGEDVKARILADPDVVLEDRDVMAALIGANSEPQGRKIVDLRGALVQRLEQRLDRLETTHRSVIAAAYDNPAGTTQIHKAVLMLLAGEPDD